MKGYILNLTIRGEGVINNHGEQFVCRPGDMLLFPPGKFITMAAIPTPASGITSGSTSARAPTGTSGSTGQRFLPRPAFFFRPDEQWQARFGELFGQIVDAGQGRGAIPNCWR